MTYTEILETLAALEAAYVKDAEATLALAEARADYSAAYAASEAKKAAKAEAVALQLSSAAAADVAAVALETAAAGLSPEVAAAVGQIAMEASDWAAKLEEFAGVAAKVYSTAYAASEAAKVVKDKAIAYAEAAAATVDYIEAALDAALAPAPPA